MSATELTVSQVLTVSTNLRGLDFDGLVRAISAGVSPGGWGVIGPGVPGQFRLLPTASSVRVSTVEMTFAPANGGGAFTCPASLNRARKPRSLQVSHVWRCPVRHLDKSTTWAPVARARVTQVLMLLRLAPEIQKQILNLPGSVKAPCISERGLRPIMQTKERGRQMQALEKLLEGCHSRE